LAVRDAGRPHRHAVNPSMGARAPASMRATVAATGLHLFLQVLVGDSKKS
jgi:hypothetical protein